MPRKTLKPMLTRTPSRHKGLKTARVPRGYAGLHCEVPGALVNIFTGLTDTEGRPVTRVEITADQYAGEPRWWVLAEHSNTPVKSGVVVLVSASD